MAKTPVKKAAKKTRTKPKNEKLAESMKGNTNSVGNKGGAPTKYTDEMVDKLNEFFDIETAPFREVVGDKGNVQLIPIRLPTLERFAVMNNVRYETLYHWAHATKQGSEELLYPEFSHAYSRAKAAQLSLMIEGGVAGAFNPSFSALFLKNAHKWKDKTEQEVKHSGSVDMTEIDASLKKAADERARKRREMEEQGLTGKFET